MQRVDSPPASFTYKGEFDKYYVNLYYEKKAEGVIHVKHFTKDGASLASVFPDKDIPLNKGDEVPLEHPENSAYGYLGYKKTTTGVEPSKSPPYTEGDFGDLKYNGEFTEMYMYYFYDIQSDGKIHVRHMVRAGPSGSYVQKDQSIIPVTPLSSTARTQSVSADAKYGSIEGYSLSYSGYSDTVTSGSSASVSLKTPSPQEAYVTFFYQGSASSAITGDFEILPGKITYRDSFTLRPKNIVVTGCIYQYHYFRITKDGFTAATDKVYGATKDLIVTESNYPYSLGVGTNDVTMVVVADCGQSDPIGPKPLEVLGPANNSPPEFQIGFVDPSVRTLPVYEVVVGTKMDLVYITDLSVPTPTDPDGDDYYFDGFDFTNGSEWIQSIPTKYASREYTDGYHGITMDELGLHRVTAKMHDEWGASTTATTYISVVPPNPIAVIDGPTEVVEGRPLAAAFSADRSYSPMRRKIDHTRDEWTNKLDVYTTPGTEIITLHVYDSAGLKSVDPDRHTLTVKPDLPPVPALNFASPTIRGATLTFQERSYSPDNDQLVTKNIWYQYDQDNDGNYEEEKKLPVSLNGDRNFTFSANKVGKYRFSIYLKEDWGRDAEKTWILNVVNDSPTVNFEVSSESKEPTIIPSVPLSPTAIVQGSAWTNSDLAGSKAKRWSVNPITGALAHNTSGASESLSDKLGPVQTDLKVSHLDLYTNQAPTYLDDGLVYTYYQAAATSSSTSSYDISLLGTAGTYGSTNQRSGEYFDLYDRHTKTAYVHRVVSNVTKYYSYTQQQFATTGSTPKEVAALPLGPAYGLLSTAYGAFAPSVTGSGTSATYWITPLSWAFGTAEGNKLQVSAEAYDVMRLGKQDSNFNRHYYNSPTYTYYKFNPVSNTLTTMKSKLQPNNLSAYHPYMDGKYLITESQFNYPVGMAAFNTDTGERTDYLEDVVGSVYVHDIILTGAGKAAYTLTDEGRFKLLWQTTDGYEKVTDLDSEGYFYVTEAKKLYRVQSRTGNRNFVYDLTDIWEDNYRTSETNVNQYRRKFYLDLDGAITMFQYYNRSDNGKMSGREAYFLASPRNSSAINHIDQQQLLGNLPLQNAQYTFKVRLNDFPFSTDDRYVGFGFHAADSRNLYRLELNLNGLRLMKVENGIRSVIAKTDYPIERRTLYPIRIQVLDGRIRAYINNVPVMDVVDGTFDKGFFGPYSELPTTEFMSMSYSDLTPISSTSKLQGIAIAGDEMIYSVTTEDPENDPMVTAYTKWRYDHLAQKFLDAGDGKSGISAHDGKTFTTPLNMLDKVGSYQISYTVKDEPNLIYPYPASDFEEYRKSSNQVIRQLIVHRRPVADYDIGFDTDNTVKWTDRSHDPDRYLSAAIYSTEATGINYLTTKGILQKKFYYITPSGLTVNQKLVVPEEIGEYTVGMAVKDEYDAWSAWVEKKITVASIPQPDEPPTAGFTLSTLTTYRGVNVTIASTASDKEDGARDKLPHQYYIRGLNPASYETLQSAVRTSWTKAFSSLGTFQIRQMVEDSKGQTAEAVRTIEIVNRAPAAQVTLPSSIDQTKPDKLTELRPAFRWFYADNDNDAMTKYQVRVYLYGGTIQQDSGIVSGASLTWTPEADLPEKINMFVRVRAYDGYDWSEWSDAKFFYIETNETPTADFDWSPKPVYEGDTIVITPAVADPDLDALSLQYVLTDPSGDKSTRSSTLTAPYGTSGPSWQLVKTGTYTVSLTVSDGKSDPVTVTKTIQVLPLQITGQVQHTAQWDEKRKQYNQSATGTNDSPRSAGTFWAGEKFMLQAQTTSTSTETKAERVEVAMGSYRAELTANSAKTAWSGELWDEAFASLEAGPVTFVFTAYYTNGTVKTASITITIAGNTGQTYGVHRQQ
ncbi:hypothetical protein FHS18_005764 [Paenibacillus phyllosphaerae]|uniref:PKD/Chitinase domain-containing protein n=1 Tax=Paenibacillus phyllosphaerae TaxID=274593 RepID=A0A7W5FQN8_9BACL|nr:hypothetical protein [Paenibacillus phyllosphaerae]MBB3113651.1 hypothetical protein [Paenibacillus phyllosphaerae]